MTTTVVNLSGRAGAHGGHKFAMAVAPGATEA